MKSFKPSMKDGMGKEKGLSPEAHKEWKDSLGKHDVDAGVSKVSGMGNKAKKAGMDSVGPAKHEKAGIAKGKHSPGSQGPFKASAGAGKSGFAMAVKKNAGKGAEGSIKGMGGAGKLNKGNGLSSGKKVKGL